MTDTVLKRFRGVRRVYNGCWTAEIRDPFTKRKVHLGTFDTGEEASRVFEATRVEFLKRKAAQSELKGIHGLRRREDGTWRAEIPHPFTKRKVHLGTFDTVEEASRAYGTTKVEFRERTAAQSAMNRARPGTDSSSQSSQPKDDAGVKPSTEGSGKTKGFRKVRRQTNGRWSAEFRDPFKNRNVFLGMFGTEEEASRAVEKVEFRDEQETESDSDMDRAQPGCESGTESSTPSGEQIEAKKVEFCDGQDVQSAVDSARPGCESANESSTQSGEQTRRQDSQSAVDSARPGYGSGTESSTHSGEPIEAKKVEFCPRQDAQSSVDPARPGCGFGTELSNQSGEQIEAEKVEFRERQEAQSAVDPTRPGTDSSSQREEQIEARMSLGSILIDNYGFLLGEFSNLDDDLTISD